MLTRWAAGSFTKCRRISSFRVPLLTGELQELSSLQFIFESQKLSPPSGYKYNLTTTDDGHRVWMDNQGTLCIPPGYKYL